MCTYIEIRHIYIYTYNNSFRYTKGPSQIISDVCLLNAVVIYNGNGHLLTPLTKNALWSAKSLCSRHSPGIRACDMSALTGGSAVI